VLPDPFGQEHSLWNKHPYASPASGPFFPEIELLRQAESLLSTSISRKLLNVTKSEEKCQRISRAGSCKPWRSGGFTPPFIEINSPLQISTHAAILVCGFTGSGMTGDGWWNRQCRSRPGD
jgi:hypothetical protein